MEFTAKQIAAFINGKIEGDENASVNTFAKIEEGKPGAISFLSNPKYTHYIYDTKSSIVLVNDDVELERPVSATLIRVKNAYECVAKLLQLYQSSLPVKKGIDSKNWRGMLHRSIRLHRRGSCHWRQHADLSARRGRRQRGGGKPLPDLS